MDISDWVLIGTTLFLGAIAIWGERIRDRIYSPKWTIKYSENPPYCIKTSYKSFIEPKINEPVYFFRFLVHNTGKTILKNSIAKIDQLWIYDSSNKPRKFDNWVEVPLEWADNRRTVISLSPQSKEYSNIGHISSKQYQEKYELIKNDIPGTHDNGLRFFFQTVVHPHSQPNCLLPGKYAIKVMLYAENLIAKELWFEISWSGKWQENDSDMFRELVLTKISGLE
jgi:hypothetical protein